jgi:hypothetical protein
MGLPNSHAASSRSTSAHSLLPPWKFTIEPVPLARGMVYEEKKAVDSGRRSSFEYRPWSPSRERPGLKSSESRALTPRAVKQRDRQTSLVYGCVYSPVSVPYGNSSNPTHYKRPKSAPPKSQIDTSLPESCLSPLPPRVDTAMNACSYPRRVPYGLVTTHTQIIATRSRPSSALSSPATATKPGWPVSAGSLDQLSRTFQQDADVLDCGDGEHCPQGGGLHSSESVKSRRRTMAWSRDPWKFVPKPEHRPRWDDVSPHLNSSPLK